MPRITQHEARTIATCAFVDPRTVHKYLAGERIAQLTNARIVKALRELGRLDLLPSSPLASDEPTPNQAA